VSALKDRMVARGDLVEEEEALIESLLGISLSTTVSEDAELEQGLRLVCGAFLQSPDYFLAIAPRGLGTAPNLSLDGDQDCADFQEWTQAAGYDVSCTQQGAR
jgi:hypothetical protein